MKSVDELRHSLPGESTFQVGARSWVLFASANSFVRKQVGVQSGTADCGCVSPELNQLAESVICPLLPGP
jgi:hypothetical protein